MSLLELPLDKNCSYIACYQFNSDVSLLTTSRSLMRVDSKHSLTNSIKSGELLGSVGSKPKLNRLSSARSISESETKYEKIRTFLKRQSQVLDEQDDHLDDNNNMERSDTLSFDALVFNYPDSTNRNESSEIFEEIGSNEWLSLEHESFIIVSNSKFESYLEEIVELILRDFVMTWLSGLIWEKDRVFIMARKELKELITSLRKKLRTVDYVKLISRDLIEKFTQHFIDVRKCTKYVFNILL
jgi:hypothetical protein